MDDVSARIILKAYARRTGIDIAKLLPEQKKKTVRIPDLLDKKHRKQYVAFSDPASKIAIDAGGRSGKTTGSLRWLMMGALMAPRSMNPFIGLTRAEAKLLAWDEIKAVNEHYDLGFTFNEADLIARAPNGAKVWVTGADQQKHIRKMRGHKYKRIVIEECGAQGAHLKELVLDVLEPRTADLKGQICMLGTPNAARAGFFFEACKGLAGAKGWSHHHWTLFDNPYLPHARAWVQENLFEARGWTEDHPTYQREYLGNWVRDDASIVYAFEEKRNTYKTLPEVEKWHAVLGIDTGWKDSTAFVVWGWNRAHPALHELFAFKRPKMIPSAIMKLVKKLRETFHLRAVVIDPAGVGTFLVEELNQRHREELGGLEVELAEKNAKRDHIELFNDDLRTGKIRVRNDSPILEEWHLLQWDETGEDEDARFENHLCFVAGTQVYTAHGAKPIEKILPGDRVWTRNGTRAVVAAGPAGVRQTYELETASGRTIRGTGNHPVWTQDGWKPLAKITLHDMVTEWANTGQAKSERIAESGTADTRSQPCASSGSTSHRNEDSASIACCGKKQMDRFRAGITSIIATATRKTTRCQILLSSVQANTQNNTPTSPLALLFRAVRFLRQSKARLTGIGQLKAASGTAPTPGASQENESHTNAHASCAALVLRQQPKAPPCVAANAEPGIDDNRGLMTSNTPAPNAASTSCETDSMAPAVALGRVLRVERTGIAESVYNLTVDDVHEYFANGIVASNCDAALYGWRRAQHFRHKPTPDGPSKGTPAWERQHARDLSRKIEKKFRKKNQSPLERDPLSPK